ncbi:hypothetical protein ACTMTF_15320 [Nonomuraea sp. ZG12]|uniref:hypothetical protein n=1 Tax=Nonomuraea sp. ZG12 TaxID=3452207 RepID=UPI003F8A832A
MSITISRLPEEPAIYSIVLDEMGDAWQRGQNGLWGCAMGGAHYEDWTWGSVQEEFGPTTFIHNGLVADDADAMEV